MCNRGVEEGLRAFEGVKLLASESKFDECLQVLKKVYAKYDDIIAPRQFKHWFGVCYYELDMLDEALNALIEARNLDNNESKDICYFQVLHYTAKVYWDLGKTKLSLDILDEAHQYLHMCDNEEYKWEYVDFLLLKGKAQLWGGDEQKAIDTFHRLKSYMAKKAPDPEIELELALDLVRAYNAAVENEKALEILQTIQVDDLDKDDRQDYFVQLCRVSIGLRKHKQALKAIQSVIKFSDNDDLLPEAYHLAGQSHFYLGHGPEAVESFRKSDKLPTEAGWIGELNKHYLEKLRKHGYE